MLTETPLRKLLSGVPAIPVMTVREVQESTEIAKALHAGGLTVFEITLRTPQAWAAVEALRKELPDACVGIGTVMREEQLRQAHESGVDFAVSAALHLPLVEAAQKLGLPYLPKSLPPVKQVAPRSSSFQQWLPWAWTASRISHPSFRTWTSFQPEASTLIIFEPTLPYPMSSRLAEAG